MIQSEFGNSYDAFVVGDVIHHALSKTIFESDNNLFSLLTMNHHPVHLNAHYSERERHGQILVVGTLVFSLAVGLTVPDISGKAIANLEDGEIKHLQPVFIGDTLYARTEILAKRPSKSNAEAGIVSVKTVAYNQQGIDVLSFSRNAMIKKEMRK